MTIAFPRSSCYFSNIQETDKYKTVELADARAVRSAWGAGCVRGTIIAIESGTLFPDQVGDPQIGEDKYLVLWGQDVINTIEFVDAPINTESLSSMDYVAAKVASARDSAINETTHAIHKTVEAATSSFMDGLLPVVKVIVIVFAIIVFSCESKIISIKLFIKINYKIVNMTILQSLLGASGRYAYAASRRRRQLD